MSLRSVVFPVARANAKHPVSFSEIFRLASRLIQRRQRLLFAWLVIVKESSSFHFRSEFFNVTNTPQFGNPSTSLGYSDPTLLNPSASLAFGKITVTVSNPRIIQFAAKFVF
jgi:hypothetical protein